jgi:colanic acid biosynthesis glycosyl transferase WcaI
MAHIVIVNQFFWPDGAPTADYAADLAEHLSSAGHEVSVICGSASYGETSIKARPRAQVFRLTMPFSKSNFGRIFSSFAFLLLSASELMRLRRPDCVVTLTTPPLLSVVGFWAKLLRGCRHVIWEMDAYPELATRLGAIEGESVFAKLLMFIASQSRRTADRVVVLGPCMADRHRENGLSAEQIAVIENWPGGADIRWRPLLPSPTLQLLYSGNLGRAHDWITLREGVRALDRDMPVTLRLAVPARDLERVSELFGTDPRCEVMALCPRADLPDALADCHIGVVTQSPETIGCLVPSKFYNLREVGRPVLFIGPESATLARKIHSEGCGWVVANGDTDGLRKLLEHLASNRGEVEECAGRVSDSQSSQACHQTSLQALEAVIVGQREPANPPVQHALEAS